MFVEIQKLSRTVLFIFLLFFTGHFIAGCNEQNKPAIEEYIRLEKTTLGVTTIASNLNVPWEIAWGPDDQIWFTEQSGTISKVNPRNGKKKLLLTIPEVYRIRTLGLLGMAIYPDKKMPYVFVDYTHKNKDSTVVSRLVRYTYTADTLKDPLILLEIPASTGHNGSRVAVSPDGKVFWATGDAAKNPNAQDITSLNGKTLRLNIDGTIPADNPIPGSPVWSRGHRNIQGLVFTPDGILFSSEHGDATDDEINIIKESGNYGWRKVQGYCDLPEEKAYCDSTPIIEPTRAWTPTIAPSGIDYYHSDKIPEWNNSILLATLKATSFRVLHLNKEKDSIVSEDIYLQKQFGRLRDICVSPDGDIYVSTSNHDWNPLGVPKPNDDRIIRIAKISDRDLSKMDKNVVTEDHSKEIPSSKILSPGATIYNGYCASCHKEDGNGVAGSFPALNKNEIVSGNKNSLIEIVLKGEAAIKPENRTQSSERMPAFGFLNDRQIADALTYIRNNWENHADSVSSAEVEGIRKKIK